MSKKKICPACLGTGMVPNHACIGASMKEGRLVSLRELARRMGYNASHLCLLEQGRRRWTPELVEEYKKHCV